MYNNDSMCYNPCHCPPVGGTRQRHVHEITGSVMVAEQGNDAHNHRFAGVSGEAMPSGGSHVHEVTIRTDFYEDHFHFITGTSGPAIPVGDRHVHFVMAQTTRQDGHMHTFRVAALIEDPIGD